MPARYFCLLAALLFTGSATSVGADTHAPRIKLQTSMGEIVLELDAQKAPLSVANFLSYVDAGHYDGTIFHRVIPGFMIQGGGFTADFDRKPANAPIRNEADNGLLNQRGTIAMARTQDPHSATAQFFISTVDNTFLDHKAQTVQGWGYTVFGRVVTGMETVDRISAVATGQRGRYRDVPKQAIIIERAVRADGE